VKSYLLIPAMMAIPENLAESFESGRMRQDNEADTNSDMD